MYVPDQQQCAHFRNPQKVPYHPASFRIFTNWMAADQSHLFKIAWTYFAGFEPHVLAFWKEMLGVLVVLTKNYPDHCFFLFAKDIPQSLICSYNIFFFKKLFCWGQVKEEGMRDDLNPKAPLFVDPHKYYRF